VKNPRAHRLAVEFAELTGESLTLAVIRALEVRLELERQRRGQQFTYERILGFAERFACGMPRDCRSTDHGTLLYGEDGLPK
jgi:hypothetical protein